MMSGKILPIFPKCYYIKDNVCSEILSELEKSVHNLKSRTRRAANFNVNSSHGGADNLHKMQPFNLLADEIIKSTKEFMIEYGYQRSRIPQAFIQTMWFNISDKGDFLFPHLHPGSFLSGAYYIKTTQENHILFHDEQKNFYENPEKMNELSTMIHPVKCEPGRLLIFHSNLEHSTPIQYNPGEKIVVSFNIVLENKKT